MIPSYIISQFLNALRHSEYGSLALTTPDGIQHSFSAPKNGAEAHLHLNDWRAISLLATKGDIGFAEAYRDGYWDSPDLAALFLFAIENERALEKYIYGNVISRMIARIAYVFTRNSVAGSKKNIHAHYDLGNEFYALWLDESMTYSSAIFKSAHDNLLNAQHQKYDRILERLGNSGSILEIGCGWGGFAERALHKGDYAFKGLTISEAQYDYARARLGNNAHIAMEDYRHQNVRYHHIVSIEMFEAVGEAYWATYFRKLKALLAEKGKAMIQTITISEDYFERYRQSGDMIRSYIFPGGMLPSEIRFAHAAAQHGLRVTDTYDFGKDYALTMQHWRERFEKNLSALKPLGFDERFIRLWRFYLTICIASFRHGRTSVMQVELQHA